MLGSDSIIIINYLILIYFSFVGVKVSYVLMINFVDLSTRVDTLGPAITHGVDNNQLSND